MVREDQADIKTLVQKRVHHLYYDLDKNCAKTTLLCLGELLNHPVGPQVLQAATGLHGAGGYRAQCGLVEGALMMIGLYFGSQGLSDEQIARLCYQYADRFTKEFGSLRCQELRPGGFNQSDPPHLCENLTAKTICFAWNFIRECEEENMREHLAPNSGFR